MKLNYRDKVILIVLAVLLVLVGGFMLFVKPAMDDCNTASDNLESKKVELADLKEQNKKDTNLKNEIKELKTKTNEVAANFYDYQIGYDANKTVFDLFSAEGVDIVPSSMKITSYSSTVLTPYLYIDKLNPTEMDVKVDEYNEMNQKSADDKTAAKTDAAATNAAAADGTTNPLAAIGCYEVDVTFTSTMDGFKKFSQNITTTREKSMVIKSVTIDDVNGISEEDAGDDTEKVGKIEGNMKLQMIVLKKIAE